MMKKFSMKKFSRSKVCLDIIGGHHDDDLRLIISAVRKRNKILDELHSNLPLEGQEKFVIKQSAAAPKYLLGSLLQHEPFDREVSGTLNGTLSWSRFIILDYALGKKAPYNAAFPIGSNVYLSGRDVDLTDNAWNEIEGMVEDIKRRYSSGER